MDFAPAMGSEKYGLSTSGPASNAPTELPSIASPSEKGAAMGKLFSLDNPLTAFGVVLAVTAGLAAFSTSVRVGNASASLDLGKV